MSRLVALVGRIGEVSANKTLYAPGVLDGHWARVSLAGHAVLDKDGPLAEPVGFGVLREEGDAVLFRGRFADTPLGRIAAAIVRRGGSRLQWSIGAFWAERHEESDRYGRRYQRISRVIAAEVSPVLRGAARETRTLEIA